MADGSREICGSGTRSRDRLRCKIQPRPDVRIQGTSRMTELTGWGRFPRYETQLVPASAPAAVPTLLTKCSGSIARGNGRAYGDAAIGEKATLLTRDLD